MPSDTYKTIPDLNLSDSEADKYSDTSPGLANSLHITNNSTQTAPGHCFKLHFLKLSSNEFIH